MHERRSKKSIQDTTEDELNAYIAYVKASARSPPTSTPSSKTNASVSSTPLGKTPSKSGQSSNAYGTPEPLVTASGTQGSKSGNGTAPMSLVSTPQNNVAQKTYLHKMEAGEPIVSVSGELYLYDHRVSQVFISLLHISSTNDTKY
jgi:hypothetical protein